MNVVNSSYWMNMSSSSYKLKDVPIATAKKRGVAEPKTSLIFEIHQKNVIKPIKNYQL